MDHWQQAWLILLSVAAEGPGGWHEIMIQDSAPAHQTLAFCSLSRSDVIVRLSAALTLLVACLGVM